MSSSAKSVNAGVPQGSIPGPLIFIVFIDDMTNKIQSRVVLYADDTAVFSTVTDKLL